MRSWLERRRWRRSQPPREAWVVLLDERGEELTQRVPIVLMASHPGEFAVDGAVTWRDVQRGGCAMTVRVIDADGSFYDKPIPVTA